MTGACPSRDIRPAVLLHGFLQEFERCPLVSRLRVSRLRDEAFQHLTLVVHGPVEIFRASIEILLPGGWISHRSR
jgi:hypothetical protein